MGEVINFSMMARRRVRRELAAILDRMSVDVDVIRQRVLSSVTLLCDYALLPDAQVDLLLAARNAEMLSEQVESMRQELPHADAGTVSAKLIAMLASMDVIEGEVMRVLVLVYSKVASQPETAGSGGEGERL